MVVGKFRATKQDNWCGHFRGYTRIDKDGAGTALEDEHNPTFCPECVKAKTDILVESCASKFVKQNLIKLHHERGECNLEKGPGQS